MTEFVTETHKPDMHRACHHAMVRLSSSYDQHNIKELYADMAPRVVTLHKIVSKGSGGNNKGFTLTADEANAFVDAWQEFLIHVAEWEKAEQERKEQEKLVEAERNATIWQEIQALAETVPGFEIIVGEEEQYNYETDKYELAPAWEVKHLTLNAHHSGLYNADDVLKSITGLVDLYHGHLQICEEFEKANWYGWNEHRIKEGKEFLATHRAFLAGREVSPASMKP